MYLIFAKSVGPKKKYRDWTLIGDEILNLQFTQILKSKKRCFSKTTLTRTMCTNLNLKA